MGGEEGGGFCSTPEGHLQESSTLPETRIEEQPPVLASVLSELRSIRKEVKMVGGIREESPDVAVVMEELRSLRKDLGAILPELGNARFGNENFTTEPEQVIQPKNVGKKRDCAKSEKELRPLKYPRMVQVKNEHEGNERGTKEGIESHLYTTIKVARDEDLGNQIGKDIIFDLVDHDKVQCFRILKKMQFVQFKEEIAREFNVPTQCQRFWLWAKRQNHTYRPIRPLTHHEESQSVGQLKPQNAEIKLFLEVRPIPDPANPFASLEKSKDEVLLFLKFYNPEREELQYVGRIFVNIQNKPMDILEKLNELAGFPPNEKIQLYEEIKSEPNVMCLRIEKNIIFKEQQLEDGDIICYQKTLTSEEKQHCRYPDVPSFLESVRSKQVVHFRTLERPKDDEFCLELSNENTYDEVVEHVAEYLGLDDPSKITLTSHNCYSQQPKPQSIQHDGVKQLSDMLEHYNNQRSDILYFEIYDPEY